MRKNYRSALMALLIVSNMALVTFSMGEGPVVLSGYKPTYTPNTNYNMPDPIQVGKFGGQMPAQLSSQRDTQASGASLISTPSFAQIQVGFGIVGDSNEPLIGAQLTGYDGSGNRFQKFADSDGYAAIIGSPGNWQITAYASGYLVKNLNRPLVSDIYLPLILQKIDSLQTLDLRTREDKFLSTGNMTLDGCELNKTIELDGNLTSNQDPSMNDPSMNDPSMNDPLTGGPLTDDSSTEDPWLEGA